jgi:DNA-binding response OmpR family regulator
VLDISVLLAGVSRFAQAVVEREFDLVVLEVGGVAVAQVESIEAKLADSSTPVLLVVDDDGMSDLHLPMRPVCDFISTTASDAEYAVRIRHLLWPGEETGDDDVVKVDELVVNLATYQVRVDDAPVDLTYMEYSLLAFMVTHPGRAYSRETLLRRVWGFDYCGGSRTVDVHVRRIRAKLGPQASSHIETVRGVGYLFRL